MISTTVAEVVTAVGGTLVDGASASSVVTDVTSDSRSVTAGSLFVALAGTRVDGHDFAAAARRSGATAVLAQRRTGEPAILVDDVLEALGRLARFHLDRLSDVTVVAVTGSVGKTTTKDLLAQLLARSGPTVAPPGSFNNELGLPLTVLAADPDTRFLVLEMGARSEGHISYLCGVAPPVIGVELMVGSAHIGEFGSHEAIVRAKTELVAALPAAGWAILNADDADVRAMSRHTSARTVTFGMAESAAVRAEHVRTDALDRASFDLVTPEARAPVTLRMPGSHIVPNALAAAAVARAIGQQTRVVAAALCAATPQSRWRMEVIERPDGVTVINDAYNASPESTRAALKSLGRVATGRRSWAVLGEMRELGDDSEPEHEAVGELVGELGINRLVVVGEAARGIRRGAMDQGVASERAWLVPDPAAAAELLHDQVEAGDVVLVKASRAVGLEVVADSLLRDWPQERDAQ